MKEILYKLSDGFKMLEELGIPGILMVAHRFLSKNSGCVFLSITARTEGISRVYDKNT